MSKGMRTEDEVRDSAKLVLGFDKTEDGVQQGTGQITTFNQLGFRGCNDKPDGWYCRMTPANPPSFWRRNQKQKVFPRKSMSRNCSRISMLLPRNTPRPSVFFIAAVLSAYSETKSSCLMRPSTWKTRTTISACVRARNSITTTSSKSRRKSTTACISSSV